MERLAPDGIVKNYAEIAGMTGLSRARVTQILNLTLLNPRSRESILLRMPEVDKRGIHLEPRLRDVVRCLHWEEQRRRWGECCEKVSYFRVKIGS